MEGVRECDPVPESHRVAAAAYVLSRVKNQCVSAKASSSEVGLWIFLILAARISVQKTKQRAEGLEVSHAKDYGSGLCGGVGGRDGGR